MCSKSQSLAKKKSKLSNNRGDTLGKPGRRSCKETARDRWLAKEVTDRERIRDDEGITNSIERRTCASWHGKDAASAVEETLLASTDIRISEYRAAARPIRHANPTVFHGFIPAWPRSTRFFTGAGAKARPRGYCPLDISNPISTIATFFPRQFRRWSF